MERKLETDERGEQRLAQQTGKIHPVDKHVGNRIRQRRRLLGLTQERLATAVGIKFQQIQKYETGANRVSASRLWDISIILKTPVEFFFEGFSSEASDAAHSPSPYEKALDREMATLLRYYSQIPEKQRRKLFEMAQAMSDQ